MQLILTTQPEILKMAEDLAMEDSINEQSTFFWDKCQHSETKNKCFRIENKDNIIGFVILKDMNFGKWGLWISLDPLYRKGTYGKLTAYLALNKVFLEYKAKRVVSDVFNTNIHSTKIHKHIMVFESQDRSILCLGIDTQSLLIKCLNLVLKSYVLNTFNTKYI